MADMFGPMMTNENLRNSFRGNSQKPPSIPPSISGSPDNGRMQMAKWALTNPYRDGNVPRPEQMAAWALSSPMANDLFRQRSQKPGRNLPMPGDYR